MPLGEKNELKDHKIKINTYCEYLPAYKNDDGIVLIRTETMLYYECQESIKEDGRDLDWIVVKVI